MIKTAVSSYSFSKAVAAGRLTEFDCVAKAAEMGFEGVEFSGLSPRAGESKTEYARALKAEAARCGIPIVNYCTTADFLKNDFDRQVETLRGELELAAELGVPTMRHDATFGYPDKQRGWRGFEQALPIVAKGCRAVTEIAESFGIRTCVENHGFFFQDSARVERLVNAVGDDNFGQLVDIGNFLCADENPVLAVGNNAPYAVHAHVKDFHYKNGGEDPGEGWFETRGGNRLRGAILGHGIVPVAQCLHLLERAGYDGYASIEFEGMEDPLLALRIGLDNLRRYLGR